MAAFNSNDLEQIMHEVAGIFDPLGEMDSRSARRAQLREKKATLKSDFVKLALCKSDTARQTAQLSVELTKEEDRKSQLLKEYEKANQEVTKLQDKQKNCLQEIAELERNIVAADENLGNIRAEYHRTKLQLHCAETERIQEQILVGATGVYFVPDDKTQAESTVGDSLDSMEVDEDNTVKAFVSTRAGLPELIEFARSDAEAEVADHIWDVLARTSSES